MVHISVEIEGISPLILNAFTDAAAGKATQGGGSAIVTSENLSPREIAQQVLYVGADEKTLIFPGPNLFSGLVEAGKFHKVGRSKVTTARTSLIPAGIMVEEMELPLTPSKWEVDIRPVRIPVTGGRILRYRPRFDVWGFKFNLVVDKKMFTNKFVRELVDDLGSKLGVGDFRPGCKGPYGRFKVVTWRVH